MPVKSPLRFSCHFPPLPCPWPVSNLSFLLKVIQRTVAKRFVAYLQVNDLLPHFQSAYRLIILLCVLSDVYTLYRPPWTFRHEPRRVRLYRPRIHDILVDRLRQWHLRCGIDLDPVVLSWTDSASFLRWNSVDVDSADSWRTTSLSYMGPLLFPSYTLNWNWTSCLWTSCWAPED